MQNNNMASEKQINYLRNLGYKGSVEGMTMSQATELIQQWRELNEKEPLDNQPKQEEFRTPQPKANPVKQLTPSNNNNSNPKSFEITTSLGTTIQLSRDSVDKYICPNLSDTEFSYLSAVCKNYGLNPYLKEIYAIKFGNQPATFIIDYKVLQQAADREPMFDGMKTGVLYLDKNGEEKERNGAYILTGETLIGAWCEVYRKDRNHANRVYALYSECCQYTKDGNPNSNWKNKPVFMTVKVAKTWALRETFPNWFSPSTYTTDEIEPSDELKKSNIADVIDMQKAESGQKSLFGDVMEDDTI